MNRRQISRNIQVNYMLDNNLYILKQGFIEKIV